MIEDMKIRNLALNTQASYLQQVSLFARHFSKSPEALGREDIRAYQLYLTQEKKLSSGSITIAVSALRFLYNVTLRRGWKLEEVIPAPEETAKTTHHPEPGRGDRVLGCIRENNHRTILTCCYAAGLRISEAIALEVTHIDSWRMVIRVQQGKGQKDRYVMLSPRLLETLRNWWRQQRPERWLFPGGKIGMIDFGPDKQFRWERPNCPGCGR
jgi:site-specific recombinase XerD